MGLWAAPMEPRRRAFQGPFAALSSFRGGNRGVTHGAPHAKHTHAHAEHPTDNLAIAPGSGGRDPRRTMRHHPQYA